MARVLKNAVVYAAGNLASAAIPFLLLPVLTRVLSPQEYGVVSMFVATVSVLGAAASLNVHAAIGVRFFDLNRSEFPSFIKSCLSIVLASSLFLFAISALFKSEIAQFTSLPVSWVLLAVVTAAMNSIVQIRLAIWTVQERAVTAGLFQFGRTLCEFGLAIYLVVLLQQGAAGRMASYTFAITVFAAIALIGLLRGWRTFRPAFENVRYALAFGIPLIPHTVGHLFLSAGDRFIINATLGTGAAGVYTVAAQIGLGMVLFMDAFNRAFVPWLFRQLSAGGTGILRRIVARTWFGFFLLLVFGGVMALLADWIILLVAGKGYEGASVPLRWIALGQAFHGMYLLVTNYVFYTKNTGSLASITVMSGMGGLAMTWLLVPMLGITGAAVSFAAMNLVKFLFTWRLAHRVYPMPWFSIMAMRVIGK